MRGEDAAPWGRGPSADFPGQLSWLHPSIAQLSHYRMTAIATSIFKRVRVFLAIAGMTLMTASVWADVPIAPEGRYLNAERPDDYVELRADKTFTIQDSGNLIQGTYTTQGKSITMKSKPESGEEVTLVVKLEADKLFDPDGKPWTRVKK